MLTGIWYSLTPMLEARRARRRRVFPAGHSLSVMVRLTKSDHRNRSCSTGANHFPSAQQHLCFPLCARRYRLTPDACRMRCRPRWAGRCFEIQQNPAALAVEIGLPTGFWQPAAAGRLLRSRPARDCRSNNHFRRSGFATRLLIIADFAIICSSGRVGLIIRFLSIGPRISPRLL